MSETELIEFLVTVIALLVGFIVGKKLSSYLMKQGVPIAAGDPAPM